MDDLFVHRRGDTEDSYMKTNIIVNLFTSSDQIVVLKDGILQSVASRRLPQAKRNWKVPKFAEIDGAWISTTDEDAIHNNILGKNDIFLTNTQEFTIPVEVTRDDYVGFYGARIIREGDIFNLRNPCPMPMFDMSIGKNYVNGFINRAENGFYIEEHNTPHFHQPKSPTSAGHIVLAKYLAGKLYITRFVIPFGCGMYIPPYVLHSDAELVGDYFVMYTKASEYRTGILKIETANCVAL
jgi:hypothetical protein